MEAAGVGADASVVGVPVGVVLNVAGAVVDAVGIVMIGAQIVSHWVSNATQGPVTRTPTVGELNDVHDAGNALDPKDAGGRLTKIGRALGKHAPRPGSAYPKPTGSPEAINEQGEDVLGDILGDTRLERIDRGGRIDYKIPGGCGAAINPDGTFSGLLEP
jgi:hypothetical protein